jgi:hypothetical protein
MSQVASYPSLPSAVKSPVKIATFAFVLLLALLAPSVDSHGAGAPLRAREVMLPMTCAELIPEAEAFRNFFEAVARGAVSTNAALSKRMFRLLAMREKLSETDKRNREEIRSCERLCAFTARARIPCAPSLSTIRPS